MQTSFLKHDQDRLDLMCNFLKTEENLVSAASALEAARVAGLSAEESCLLSQSSKLTTGDSAMLRRLIRDGQDPLGEAFCRIRSASTRRAAGATYTPHRVIAPMLDWCRKTIKPAMIVDPGTGSGRFLAAAAQVYETAQLIGIESDPLAALMARANLAALGLDERGQVLLGDFREAELPPCGGKRLFIGNPPYVRHHLISPRWKEWLASESQRVQAPFSRLAGLHLYFFLAVKRYGRPGDAGAFITSAEWLDVNYGKLLRHLLLNGLGGKRIAVVDPKVRTFEDAATTAAITCFEIARPSKSVAFQRIASSSTFELGGGTQVSRKDLKSAKRWTPFVFSRQESRMKGHIELGELFRVHRGQVTGANRIWIEGEHSRDLPDDILYPSITRAKELFDSDSELRDAASLRRVIDIPADLSELADVHLRKVERFLAFAREAGADQTYVARNRRAWWSVGLREPAPILCSYMARRAPAFVRNLAGARHINIAHGLYPQREVSPLAMNRLVTYLSTWTRLEDGRFYAGGLVKFEPREVERLLIPKLDVLEGEADEFADSLERRSTAE